MITKEQALTLKHGTTLYHMSAKNADGTAMRCRVNGKCKTWKRTPQMWQLPVKHGFRTCFYIGPVSQNDWTTLDPQQGVVK